MLALEEAMSIFHSLLTRRKNSHRQKALTLLFSLCLCGFLRAELQTLNPPKAENVAAVRSRPAFNVFTNQIYFSADEGNIKNFLKNGVVYPHDYNRSKLLDIAPLHLPKNLNKDQATRLNNWKYEGDFKTVSTTYGVCEGAMSTSTGEIFFWKKLNDKVLWLATENSVCYLVVD